MRYDLASKQFSLAAQNGDPSTVRIADEASSAWYLMTFTPMNETTEELNSRLERVTEVTDGLIFYCKNR